MTEENLCHVEVGIFDGDHSLTTTGDTRVISYKKENR